MSTPAIGLNFRHLATLLRGEAEVISHWAKSWNAPRLALHIAIIIVGAGLYGAAMGSWRAPEQALFVAIKFPLILLLTATGNALLNGMLAPLLGLNIPFRQSFLSVMMSCSIAAAILGSFAPLTAFLVWNAPPMSASHISGTYSFIMLAQVIVIAFAGLTANLRLYQLLVQFSGNKRALARRVLIVWLAGNLFFGSQLSWVLRPFIGSPNLPVQFVRAKAFKGNFYEAVFHSFVNIFND
ncbi:MAG TPA: hypothetical protein VH255_01335 [Verrucomicrobiae bacterium]|nr:hypothetical protein [Verrucomicrobiae bacterium]